MANWAWDYLSLGIVRRIYVEPEFHFTYYGFDWVQPWPGNGMYVHFLVLMVASLFICVGFLYRLSALTLAIGFTYFFLLERTNYQNHYYLIVLIAWWLPWMPLNRNVSVDAWIWPKIKSDYTEAWVLWVIRFHLAVPYFFGGIAKITPDWLLGQPMSEMVLSKANLPLIGPVLATEYLGLFLSWSGLLFDLTIVPLLMWRRTRVWACVLCAMFHLMNAVIFNIHIFPWFMLASTPLFFEPDWPRRILGGAKLVEVRSGSQGSRKQSLLRPMLVGFLGCYVTFHCLWPLRHLLYKGDASWTEQGHYFAWRMMLRGKKSVMGFAIQDRVTGKVVDGMVDRFVCKEQSDKFGRDPEMILHFAHFLADKYKKTTGKPASVYVLALASLNGRKPELLIDPNVDLAEQPRGFYRRSWVMPQNEPLRQPAWDVPVEKWREHVEIPELHFMKKDSSQTAPK